MNAQTPIASHATSPAGKRRVRESALLVDLRRCYAMTSGNRLRRVLTCARAPGIHAVVVLRFGQWCLRRHKLFRLVLDPIYAVLNLLIHILWGIDIPRHTRIGPGLYIGHFGGIVVSARAVIGRNCNLSQNITIGVSGEGSKRAAPTIGDNVYIAPGARVFGGITIGNNVKIGANAVVHKDLPDNAIAVLDPGFSILFRATGARKNTSNTPPHRDPPSD